MPRRAVGIGVQMLLWRRLAVCRVAGIRANWFFHNACELAFDSRTDANSSARTRSRGRIMR